MKFYYYLMAFLLTAVHCKPPALPCPCPHRPMTPTERIFGVFQASTGDIISLNNSEFYMIEGSEPHGGRYTINELGILELHRPDEIVRFEIVRENTNRHVVRLVGVTGTTFERIISEEQYNNNDSALFHLTGEYRSLDREQSYFFNLNSYRVSTFSSPDVTRSMGGYYVDDNNLRVISNQGSRSFTIVRNSRGRISSLRHITPERDITLAREGFIYSADELTMLNRNIIGRAFQANLINGQSFEIISQNPFELPYVIEGEPIDIDFLQQELRVAVQNHGFNYNGDYLFRLILRPGSRTEIECFEAILLDCPIRSLTRIFRE